MGPRKEPGRDPRLRRCTWGSMWGSERIREFANPGVLFSMGRAPEKKFHVGSALNLRSTRRSRSCFVCALYSGHTKSPIRTARVFHGRGCPSAAEHSALLLAALCRTRLILLRIGCARGGALTGIWRVASSTDLPLETWLYCALKLADAANCGDVLVRVR